MSNPKSTTFTKFFLVRGGNLCFFLFLALVGFPGFFNSQPQPKTPELNWQQIPKKEWNRKLKAYSYAKVKQSLKSPFVFSKSYEVNYTPCPEPFPQLPGEFPCNFLEFPQEGAYETTRYLGEYEEGGKIPIYLSHTKPRFYSEAVLLTPYWESDEVQESSRKKHLPNHPLKDREILLIYHPQGKLSHYQTPGYVVVFFWAKEEGQDTLKSILQIQVQKNLDPEFVQEIDFSR